MNCAGRAWDRRLFSIGGPGNLCAMADQQRMLEDFAALPVTPEAKAALLSALPLPTLVGLLGDESRVELV